MTGINAARVNMAALMICKKTPPKLDSLGLNLPCSRRVKSVRKLETVTLRVFFVVSSHFSGHMVLS